MITIENKTAVSSKTFLEKIGIYGLSRLEPLILASLAQESPVLLIGSPGTAKTKLFEKLSFLLGFKFRHYNASQVCIDDLIGYPVRSKNGEIEFAPTPATCWDAEAVFIDELSRCKPETQNKFFSLIYEKKLSGVKLRNLVHRWAAMNPPKFDDDPTPESLVCEGAFPLDAALADRFNYIIQFPDYFNLSEQAKRLVICPPEGETAGNLDLLGEDLAGMIKETQNLYQTVSNRYTAVFGEFVYNLANEFKKYGYHLTGRRTNIIFQNLIFTAAASEVLNAGNDVADIAVLAAKNSVPFRAYMNIEDCYLETFVARTVNISKLPADIKKMILLEPDPAERVFTALENQNKIDNAFLNELIEDAVYKLVECEKICYILTGYKVLCKYTLSAGVADELSYLFQSYASPINIEDDGENGFFYVGPIPKRSVVTKQDKHYECLNDFIEDLEAETSLNNLEKDAVSHAARKFVKDFCVETLPEKELRADLRGMLAAFKRYSARFGEIIEKYWPELRGKTSKDITENMPLDEEDLI